jgi:RHS repeat-associated protein
VCFNRSASSTSYKRAATLILALVIGVLMAPGSANAAPTNLQSPNSEPGEAPHYTPDLGVSSGAVEGGAPPKGREARPGAALPKRQADPDSSLSSAGQVRGSVSRPTAKGRVAAPLQVEASPLTSNEAGDSLEVRATYPSAVTLTESGPETGLLTCGATTTPYRGSDYSICGEVYAYDAQRESSQVPMTNTSEQTVWDACGTEIGRNASAEWHNIGTESIQTPAWAAGGISEVPSTEPTACLGTWKVLYTFNQTFSDGERLSASIEGTFTVTAVAIEPSATWGGGNPTELPCSQICNGDPVNTATGDYFESVTDLSIPERGPALAITRTYSSLAAHAGLASALGGPGWSYNYGSNLKVDSTTGEVTIKNDNGSQTSFEPGSGGEYEAPPRVLATLVHNEDGTWTYTVRQRTIYTFNEIGKLIKIADLNGNAITFAYNESGQLQRATDNAGRWLEFTYKGGVMSEVSDSSGRAVSYEYDSSFRLDRVIDARGKVTTYAYNASNFLRTRTSPSENIVLTNKYDEGGRVLSQADGLEHKTTYSYTWIGPIEKTDVTEPRGYVTEYEYDEGFLAAKTEAKGTEAAATWTYDRDPNTGGITSATDPNNHTTHATYDSRGNKTSIEDALGGKTESVYDSLNDLTEYTDAEGVTTTYEYDSRGNRLKEATPLLGSEPAEDRITTYAHEDEAHPDDVTAITDPNGKTAHFAYDTAGDLISVTDPESDKTTYTYNGVGQRLTQVSPRGNVEGAKPSEYTTTYTYDAAGNRVTAIDPLGHERIWSYDADGNLEAETDSNGHMTSYTYNVDDQQIKVERPNGDTNETAYDADGSTFSQTDGLKHTTTYEYDPLEHLSANIDPLSRKTTYVYDALGNLKSEKDANGRTTTYSYDAAGRLSKVSYSDGTTPTAEYGYDKDGRRTSMSDGTGKSTAEYDSLGHLVATTDGNGDTIKYGYDLAGNQLAITYPNGKTVNREYDGANRLSSVSDWLGNTTSFSYGADSSVTSTIFPEGTGSVDEYAYDRADQLSGIQMKHGSVALASLAYTRDRAGEIESLTSQGLPGVAEESFSYDKDSRMTKAGLEGFAYDAANNLTELAGKTSTYDAANQLTSRAGVSFAYNGVGERINESPLPATYVSSFGSLGTGNGQFNKTAGIARDAKGNLWVVDYGNQRVEKFSQVGEYLFSFGSLGTKNGQLYDPSGIAIDSEGHIWVADWGNGGRVQEFSEAGKYMTSFGKGGAGNGEFELPEAITFDSKGNIWVADCCDGRIQEFSSKGKFIKKIGTHGTAEGQIWSSLGIAFDSADNLWVADFGNKRIEQFTEEGKFLKQFGTKGSGNGEFKGPGALSIDSEGHIWVVDGEGGNRVEEFTQSGEFLGEFGSTGSGAGQFEFKVAMAITTDTKGNIWVSDGGNDRVQHWQMTGPKATSTYKYDQAGNLTAVDRPKAGELPAIEESYTYDGGGLRASQTISGTTTRLAWDPSGELPLLLNDGSTNYIYGPTGLPIEQISGTTPTYYHHDQLGSTRMLTNASGAVAGTFSYSAYGTLSGKTGTQTTPFEFAGQYTNASGLQYLRARTYDPATGQFLSKDPAAEAPSYGYSEGNPLRFVDPSGECGISPGEWLDCPYQAVKSAIDLFGGDAETIAQATGVVSLALAFIPPAAPLAAALAAVSSAASAYAAGEAAGDGNTLQAAIDGLGSLLGGTAVAERLVAQLDKLAPTLAGESAAEQREALADLLDELGYLDLATSIANTLCPIGSLSS